MTEPKPNGVYGPTLPDWPYLAVSWCPYCEQEIDSPILTRWREAEGTAEYRCPLCGRCHVRDRTDVDRVHFFYIDDIEAMIVAPSQLFRDWHEEWAAKRGKEAEDQGEEDRDNGDR
jgi:hypothetical protein